jgi:hypothetical protein
VVLANKGLDVLIAKSKRAEKAVDGIDPVSTAVLVILVGVSSIALRHSRRRLDKQMAGPMFIEAEVVDDTLTR